MTNLPSGTITFLFTDIEGSTKLWEQHPEQMRLALARHDALMQQSIAQHEGHVIKTLGDGFHAVFADAAKALAAALTAQRALHAETWPEPAQIRARMALHSGQAEERDGDYFGTSVNRAARLMAIGHGGQALLSSATRQLIFSSLPAETSLKDMGSHRLKDLQEPEHVYQFCHSDLRADFPPLNSLDLLPNNLPRQLTSFIGREPEMQQVKQLLANTPLLTLTGAGGCGKTRLALQVAADLTDEYKDGVWLVELAALSDPALVPQSVTSALGLREQPGRSLTETLTDYLRFKTLLLLLDNCEHLVEACARLADTLLRSCPQVKLLATSRESLNIAGESTYLVPSLLQPSPDTLPTAEKDLAAILLDYDAVRLFVERAKAHRSDFALTRQNGTVVAEVCHRLDGIPLAIELAAARVRALPLEQIASRLDDRFRLLTGGGRTALPRQQTLRALIDWSYNLLNASERRLLNHLSVFAGGWTLEVAEKICSGEGIEEWEVMDLLISLVDKSLVMFQEGEGQAEGRYSLLETIRQYGQERLTETGEVTYWRDRHRDYFLALAEEAEPQLRGPEVAMWLDRLEDEHDNLRSALTWCQVEEGRAEAGLRLAGALWRFWQVHGHLSEGRAYLAEALRSERTAGRTKMRARALAGVGNLASNQGDYAVARTQYEQSLAIMRELGDKQGIAASLHNLGDVANRLGDYGTAKALYEQSLALSREMGNKMGIAASLHELGVVAYNQGD